jgi:hypothetical protein
MKRYLPLALLAVGVTGVALAANMPTFDQVDSNHDGKISKQEASKVEGVDFSTWDLNGDGYISRDEWNKMTKNHQ